MRILLLRSLLLRVLLLRTMLLLEWTARAGGEVGILTNAWIFLLCLLKSITDSFGRFGTSGFLNLTEDLGIF